MNHQHERLALIALVLKPVQCLVGDAVANIALRLRFALLTDKDRIDISALSRQYVPTIEALHFSIEMNLADHRRLITVLLKDLLKM